MEDLAQGLGVVADQLFYYRTDSRVLVDVMPCVRQGKDTERLGQETLFHV